MAKDDNDTTSRRSCLKLASLATPAAVAVAATAGEASEALPDPTSEKMQDTPHTRAYFQSARF